MASLVYERENCVAGRENFPHQNLIEIIEEPVLCEKKLNDSD